MADEDKGKLQKATEEFTDEMANKSPSEAVADDLGSGGTGDESGSSSAGEEALDESKGQASGTPGGPGVYRENKSD